MKEVTIILSALIIALHVSAQEPMTKIQLKEGSVTNIQHSDLNIGTLLQVYDDTSADHLIGDVYLKVENNNELMAEFYVDKDSSSSTYYTQVYKNYFLTFRMESDHKYLIIKQSELGKAFALSSNGKAIINEKDHSIAIEIVDFMSESGYDAPPEVESRSYFSFVTYTIKVTIGDSVKNFTFSSNEIENNYTLEMGDYQILILSEVYKDTSCLLEMIVQKVRD